MAPEPAEEPAELERVVEEVAREAHVEIENLRPEEKAYLKDHVLKKPMGVLHVWALGVGVVITGEYFGWNPGLKEGGPIGMLLTPPKTAAHARWPRSSLSSIRDGSPGGGLSRTTMPTRGAPCSAHMNPPP